MNATAALTLHITGMTCPKCVRIIGEALRELDAVTDAQVDRDQGRAQVWIRRGADTPDTRRALVDAVQALVNGKFQANIAADAKENSPHPKGRKLSQNKIDDILECGGGGGVVHSVTPGPVLLKY